MAKWLLMLVVAPWLALAQTAEWKPPRVKVKAGVVYQSPKDILVLVTLDNSNEGCRAVMVNEVFFAYPSDGPITLLDFEITDASGRQMTRTHKSGGTRPRFVPGDLMTLNCGVQYGWYVSLSRFDWAYPLEAGRYRLRARVENRMHEYFAARPKELERIQSMTGRSEEEIKALLRDFSATSDEVTFAVGG